MRIDDKAKEFMRRSKQAGKSKEETMSYLQSKGYELGVEEPVVQETPIEPMGSRPPIVPEQTTTMGEVGRGVTNVIRDVGAILPFEGLQEKAEARVRAIGDETYEEALERVRRDKELWDIEKNITLQKGIPTEILPPQVALPLKLSGVDNISLPTWTDEALEVSGGIASGGVIGKAIGLPDKLAKMGKLGEKALDFVVGAVEAGTLSNTPLGYVVGGATGLIAPELVQGAVKSTSKFAGKFSKPIGDVLGDILTTTKGKSVTELATDNKSMSKILKGIDASKDTARVYSDVADSALENTYDRTQGKISKALGVDEISDFGKKAKKQYSDTLNKYKNKIIKKDLYTNDVLKDALDTARKQDLTGELSDLDNNSLGVAQRAKEVLDDRIAKNQTVAGLAEPKDTVISRNLKKIKRDFVAKLDNLAPEYKQVRADYGKYRESQNLIDDILKPRGKEESNLASTLLTNKNKLTIKEVLGEDKLNNFTKILREEDDIFRNLKTISTKSKNRIQDRSAVARRIQKAVGLKELAAPVAVGATISPTAGAGVVAGEVVGGLASDIYKGSVAKGLMQDTQQLDPFVRAIIAQQAGGIGQ